VVEFMNYEEIPRPAFLEYIGTKKGIGNLVQYHFEYNLVGIVETDLVAHISTTRQNVCLGQ